MEIYSSVLKSKWITKLVPPFYKNSCFGELADFDTRQQLPIGYCSDSDSKQPATAILRDGRPSLFMSDFGIPRTCVYFILEFSYF